MTATDSVFDDISPGLSDQDDLSEGLHLDLEVTDNEVIAELAGMPARERIRYASTALRIGVLCLRQARGEIDSGAISRAGDELLGELRELLTERAGAMTGEMVRTLAHYLDPDSGVVHQRMKALLDKDGELERVLGAHLAGDQSMLARTLATHLGEHSPLFRMLAPDEADGLRARIAATIEELMVQHRNHLVAQFSLDDAGSALSRLVREVENRQAKLGDDVKGQVDLLKKELTLDRPESALSRMHEMLQSTQGQIDKHLTLDDDASALGRIRRELLGGIESMHRSNAAFQAEVREALVAMQARKVEAARGTAHGNDFEAAAGAVIADLASRRGDLYEATGATTGVVRNCKVGDHIVEMGADSRAPGARIVFEAKQKEGVRLRDALAEIDTARKNREAQVGVFIYSARTAPEGLESFARHGDDIVVLWDADDPSSDIHLRAAYSVACALAMATRSKDESTAASLRGIDIALRSIEKQLKHLADMNKWAKTVESSGNKIASRTERMQADLTRDIELIDEQLETLAAVDGVGS